ncbi:MAG: DUF5985 family protein [Rhodospirillaceae bacterium]
METARITLYLLAIATSLACTLCLFRAYVATKLRLLLWSGFCFVGLTVNNVALFFDLVVYPTEVDLRPVRLIAALVGMVFLLYGFIFESE